VDDLLPRLPALAGWAAAWAVVVVAGLLATPRGQRSAGAVAQAAAAVPVAHLLSGSLRGAVGMGDVADAALLGLLAHGAIAGVTSWLRAVIAGGDEPAPPSDPPPSTAPRATSGPGSPSRPGSPSPSPSSPTSTSASPPRRSAPRAATIRAASGTVVSSGPAAASEERARGQALLAMLEEGSDVHRGAAARALAVPFTGSSDPAVGRALLAVVDDPAVARSVRAEAAITLGLVFGLEAPDPEGLRRDFEGALSEGWLSEVRAAVG
jgi:hypothetical protein